MLGDRDRLRRWCVRLGAAVVLAAALAVAPKVVAGGDGRLERLRGDAARARAAIQALESANAARRAHVHALKTDPRAIEDIARGELGMTYPGELVIRVEAGVEVGR